MNLIDRILSILNEIVILLWQIFLHSFYVFTPSFLRKILRKVRIVVCSIGFFLFKKIFHFIKIFIQKIIWLSKKIIEPFIRFESAFQETVENLVHEVKSIKIADLTPSSIGKKLLGLLLVFLQGMIQVWKSTWGNMSNQMIATICLLVFISLGAGFQIFLTSEKMYKEIKYKGREPASQFELESKLKRRPDYYKQETRHYQLKQLRVPIYIQNEKAIRIFEADATIELTNRFVTRFFSENENRIRDRLLSTMEPVISEFPFTEEGKHIMKEKITKELNDFIEENEIEGSIEDIYFNDVAAI